MSKKQAASLLKYAEEYSYYTKALVIKHLQTTCLNDA